MTVSKKYMLNHQKEEELDPFHYFLNVIHSFEKIPLKKQEKITEIFINNLNYFPETKKFTEEHYLKNGKLTIKSSPPKKYIISKTMKCMIFVFLASLCYYFFNNQIQEKWCSNIYDQEVKEANEVYNNYISSWEATEPIREDLLRKKLYLQGKKKEHSSQLAVYKPTQSIIDKINIFKPVSTAVVLSDEKKMELEYNEQQLVVMETIITSVEETLKKSGTDTFERFNKNVKKGQYKLEKDLKLYADKKEECIIRNKTNELFFHTISAIIMISTLFDRSIIHFILNFSPYSAVLNDHGVDFMLVLFFNILYWIEIGYGKIAGLISYEIFSTLTKKAKEGTLSEVFNMRNTILTIGVIFIIGYSMFIILKHELKKKFIDKKSKHKTTTSRRKTPKTPRSIVKRKSNKTPHTPRRKNKQFEELLERYMSGKENSD